MPFYFYLYKFEERGAVPEQLIKKLEQFELTGLLVPKVISTRKSLFFV